MRRSVQFNPGVFSHTATAVKRRGIRRREEYLSSTGSQDVLNFI